MNRKQPHAGIILLVVLSSLTFFSVLLAAYLVFSNQSRYASFAISSRNIHRHNVNGIIDDALMTFIRGTDVKTNPFYGEDLLSDYYGRNEGYDLTVGTVNAASYGFIRFNVTGTGLPTTQLDDLLAGRVITFTNGDLNNRSFRVLRSFGASAPTHGLVIDTGDLPVPVAGNTLRMNGVPRNSPGLGFDLATSKSDEMTSTHAPVGGDTAFTGFNLPVALQPNHGVATFDKSALANATTFRDFDEPYDAADFNNWFLSYRHSDGTVIPSFHRPSVINYILNEVAPWNSPSTLQQRQLLASLSRATFRPLPIKATNSSGGNILSSDVNPQFTGGNSNFALRLPMQVDTAMKLDQLAMVLTGTDGSSGSNPDAYDVDNDADGNRDSIWVDLGLPLITAPDGKLLRPLVAPMIEDLSGRLNVNAHHNVTLTANTAGVATQNAEWAGTRNIYGTAANNRATYRGSGFGPAEIAIPIPALGTVIERRYRDAQTFSAFPRWSPGGAGNNDDPSDIVLNGSRPQQHSFNVGYGFTTDPFGRGGMAINRAGGVLIAEAGITVRDDDTGTANLNELVDESINEPYEFDPTGRLSKDVALDFDELEGILRAYYFDGENLSSTLTSPLSGLGNYVSLARQLTTSSVSNSSPPPFKLTSGMTNPATVYGSLANWMVNTKNVPVASIKALIAPELRMGNRIDVNRPFGNGVDNSTPANYTIDEPSESESLAFDVPATSPSSIPSGYDTSMDATAPDYNLDDPLTASARQLLARHLYILMMALADGKDFPTVSTTIDAAEYKARRMAQWAVNVVDYRDPDSIMTPFQYDSTPFDGSAWTPNQTVFGVEQPELVLSETLAFHDVRVRDTDKDDGTGKKIGGPMDDVDTDQVRLPQGSLFVELMCPRTAPNSPILSTNDHRTKAAYPAELYDLTGVMPQLNLSATNPAGTPVWRLAMSEPHYAASKTGDYDASGNQSNDPVQVQAAAYDAVSFQPANLDPLATGGASPTLILERFFVFQSAVTTANIISNGLVPAEMTATNTFFANSSGLRLSPGQFAVIAPRTITHLGSQGASQPEKPSDQRFVQSATNAIMQFGLDTGAGSNPKMPNFNNSTSYNTALNIFAQIDRPRPPAVATAWPATRFQDGFVGLNVSEPLPNGGDYYREPTAADYLSANPGVYPISDAYLDLSGGAKTALDKPADSQIAIPRLPKALNAKGSGDEIALGTIPRYCSVFLQRLADPLSPFNATTNPYITVDWMSVDLNVFSGEEEASNVVTSVNNYARRSRQKNGQIDRDRVNALYSYQTNAPNDPTDTNDPNEPMVSVDTASQAYFAFADDGNGNHSVHHSLSFLNTDEVAVNPNFQGFTHSIGSEGAAGVTGYDRNLPRFPYAKHTWLNRPFVTPFELMMVPTSSPGRLFHEFSVSKAMTVTSAAPLPAAATPPAVVTITSTNHGLQTGDTVMIDGVQRTPSINGMYKITLIDQNQFSLDGAPATVPSQYVAGSGTAVKIPSVFAAAASSAELVNFYSPFSHLLNFTHTPVNVADAINFSRLFDYVQTRPPFRGEVELLDKTRSITNPDVKELFTPPFNCVIDNHRVGQINLNSIENFETWKGLMLGHLNDQEATSAAGIVNQNQLSFNAFLNSRRGYSLDETTTKVSPSASTVNYDATKFDSAYPTQFAGVFTENSLSSAFPTLRTPAASAVLQRRAAEAGLFRSRGIGDLKSYTSGMSGDAPRQFVRDPSEFPVTPRWTQWQTASPINDNFHRDRARNPAMKYQTLMRMPNLVSDNSQIFLIRMTVGFFEVDASNTANLGAEYGESTGQTQRHRAMFIIDRSIPVGFKPGQDLNARDTVVFERYYP